MVRVRQQDGLSYTVSSSLSAGAMDPVGSFSTFAIYAPQNAGKLETAVREEVEREGLDLAEHGEPAYNM